MNNTWIDEKVVQSDGPKADDAVIHTTMWDDRIKLSFQTRLGVDKLIICLRALLFRYYKRSLFLSFIKYLACEYKEEYKAYRLGNRQQFQRRGENRLPVYIAKRARCIGASSKFFLV